MRRGHALLAVSEESRAVEITTRLIPYECDSSTPGPDPCAAANSVLGMRQGDCFNHLKRPWHLARGFGNWAPGSRYPNKEAYVAAVRKS